MISFDDCEKMARFASDRNAYTKRFSTKKRYMTRLERYKIRCRFIWILTTLLAAFLLFFILLLFHSCVDVEKNFADDNFARVEYTEPILAEAEDDGAPSVFEVDKIDDSIFEKSIRLDDVTVTHYDPCVKCCGKTDGITATGVHVTPYYTVAVDPGVIPLGSDVMVDYGDGVIHYYKAEDTGGGVKGNHIDLCVTEHDEALELGVRYATVWFVQAG